MNNNVIIYPDGSIEETEGAETLIAQGKARLASEEEVQIYKDWYDHLPEGKANQSWKAKEERYED